MEVTWNPGARARAVDHEGRATGAEHTAPAADAPQSLRLVVQPGARETVCAIVEVSRGGKTRWERRTGLVTVSLTRAELANWGTPRFLQAVCMALADGLSPHC